MGHTMMAPFLLPAGYHRPPLAALARERSVVTEAGRLAVRRGTQLRPWRRPTTEPGAHEPVMLVPGFLAGDWTLLELSAHLRREGFRTHRVHIRANVGCTLDAATLLETRAAALAERTGSRVRIVGHSLGGMLARGVAVRRPDLVAGVVTMGSPVQAPAAHHKLLTSAVTLLTHLNKVGIPGVMSLDCVGGACAAESFAEVQRPLDRSVELTTIYSRRDGVVDWRACIDPDADQVEVTTSHIGMAFDPRVADHVVRALLRQERAWLSAVPDADIA